MVPKWPEIAKNSKKMVIHNTFLGKTSSPFWAKIAQMMPQIDFRNRLHWNSAPLAVVLSGYMTSL